MSANPRLARMLALDPLAEAEEITGKSYKEDDATGHLGMLIALTHNEAKRKALEEAWDTTVSMSFAGHLEAFLRLGFAEVLRDSFSGRSYGSEPAPDETFVVLWHPDGLLATCESHMGDHRNTAKVYYNHRATAPDWWYAEYSSGGLHDGVWVGDHDVREAMSHKINGLRSIGEFLPKWTKRPFLWLLTYTDSDIAGYDYRSINEERISRLPQHVQDAITPEVQS